MKDNVNHPSHYNYAGVECIDAIQAATGKEGFETYLQGNIMKYKTIVEDLQKAKWYLEKLISVQE